MVGAFSHFAAQVSGVGALAEPARRDLYLYVVAQPEPVSRDQAAAGTGCPGTLPSSTWTGWSRRGCSTPSSGDCPDGRAPARGARRSSTGVPRQVTVTLPERHYDLAGQLLAPPSRTPPATATPVLEALQRAAADGRRAPLRVPGPATRPRRRPASLAAHGYEPRAEATGRSLANCPFHALAREHTELVCGMNLDLITALLDELAASTSCPGSTRHRSGAA